jgi:hypothetical protein
MAGWAYDSQSAEPRFGEPRRRGMPSAIRDKSGTAGLPGRRGVRVAALIVYLSARGEEGGTSRHP